MIRRSYRHKEGYMKVRRFMARVFTILIYTLISEVVINHQIARGINMRKCHGTEGVQTSSSAIPYFFLSGGTNWSLLIFNVALFPFCMEKVNSKDREDG